MNNTITRTKIDAKTSDIIIKTNREQRILNNLFESYSKTMLNTIKKNEQKNI